MENSVMTSALEDHKQCNQTTLHIRDVMCHHLGNFLDEHHFIETSTEDSYESVRELFDRSMLGSSSGGNDCNGYLGAVQGQEYILQHACKDADNLTGDGCGKNLNELLRKPVEEDERERLGRRKQTRNKPIHSFHRTDDEQEYVQEYVDSQEENQEDDEDNPRRSADGSSSNASLEVGDLTSTLDTDSRLNAHTGMPGGKSVQATLSSLGVRKSQLKTLPKLELHAHLNGCVRSSTLLDLFLQKGWKGKVSSSDLECLIRKEDRSLTECFRLFPVIHALTTDHAVVTRITKEAIEDFILDNVVYLELRTTPKSNEVYGMSKRSYVEAVLVAFEAAGVPCNRKTEARSGQSGHHMHVRLLLSIDRRESTEAAMETVELAWDMKDQGVVGVDLSGDPSIGNWETFLPALTRAKQLGVPLTLHCGEVSNPEEIRAMLALKPSRLGHVCCLEQAEWRALLESGIPVEICLTSNVRTESVASMSDHHFGALYTAKHPVVLCTDDPGLFSTSLSLEYAIASTCFGLTEMELLCMAKRAINYSFADEVTKLVLHEIFDDALRMVEGDFYTKCSKC